MFNFDLSSLHEGSFDGERRLIAAILVQAVHDASGLSGDRQSPTYKRTGLRFLDKNNRDFQFFCSLLGWDPEYADKKIKEKLGSIQKKDLAKLRK